MFQNNLRYVLKKYLFELLKERYGKNEGIIDRLSYQMITEDDVTNLVKMVGDAYETGYLKAVNDYREQIRKLGYEVQIVPEKKE